MNSQLKKDIFLISNFLSILRLMLVIPIALLLFRSSDTARYIAVLIGIIAVITDGLDGYFARKYNQITDLGKIIDPLADKILMGVVSLICVIKNFMPIFFFMLLLSRDIIILMGGLYLKNKKRIIPQSNMLGKVTAGVVAFYLLISILFYPQQYVLRNVFLWIGSILIIVSFVQYAIRFFNIFVYKE